MIEQFETNYLQTFELNDPVFQRRNDMVPRLLAPDLVTMTGAAIRSPSHVAWFRNVGNVR